MNVWSRRGALAFSAALLAACSTPIDRSEAPEAASGLRLGLTTQTATWHLSASAHPLASAAGRTQREVQRHHVIFCRMSARTMATLSAVIEQGGRIVCRYAISNPIHKLIDPGLRCTGRRTRVQLLEVVRDAARTHQQHTLIGQWRQQTAQRICSLRSVACLN